MKKLSILIGVAAFGVILAQSGSLAGLSGHVKALAEAKALTASLTYQQIGGSPSVFKVEVAKPNLARIDRGDDLIVADGKTVTVFDKKANTYFKSAQTSDALGKYFTEDELSLLAPFFNPAAFDKLGKQTAAGTKNRKGIAMNVVEINLDPNGRKKATYFIDPGTGLIRQIEYAYNDTGTVVRMLVDTKELTLKNEIDQSLFAFKAPDGSKELTEADMTADKWYYDLKEAKEVAKKTKRLLMVDFYADW